MEIIKRSKKSVVTKEEQVKQPEYDGTIRIRFTREEYELFNQVVSPTNTFKEMLSGTLEKYDSFNELKMYEGEGSPAYKVIVEKPLKDELEAAAKKNHMDLEKYCRALVVTRALDIQQKQKEREERIRMLAKEGSGNNKYNEHALKLSEKYDSRIMGKHGKLSDAEKAKLILSILDANL